MVPISITYDGKLRCTAVHGPSGARLITDAPKDNQGEGASFSPTDLLATAYGTCLMTIMGIVARRDGIALEGTRVDVEKHMTAAPPRRVARLAIRITPPATVPRERRQTLEQAARTCPVALSVGSDVAVDLAFAWPD